MEDFYVPRDNDSTRELYEREGLGVCGPAVIATLTKKKVGTIIDDYIEHYKGHQTFRNIKEILKLLGINFKQKNGHKVKEFPLPKTEYSIVRVQWLGKGNLDKYHGWNYWVEATQNTHYILIRKIGKKRFCFCNAIGWFFINNQTTRDYLEEGYITSYLDIENV